MDQILMWVIGGLVAIFAAILSVFWAYTLRVEERVTVHNDTGIEGIKTEIGSDIKGFKDVIVEWMKTMRAEIKKEHEDIWKQIRDDERLVADQSVANERRFATKDDFSGMKAEFNDMRREVNNQISGVSGQLATVVTMLSQKKD